MPITIKVTKREIKNKQSGIDMTVNSYEKASTPKLVKNYHVVVITNLPFFKLPEHSDEDVVQFMVPRDYDAFEKLQKEITQSFPGLKLPTLPRKFHLFVNDGDIEERQVAFDCLLKVLAKDKAKGISVPMLQFMGFDLLADKNYYKRRKEFLQKEEEDRRKVLAKTQTTETSGALFGDDTETNDDLFGDIPQKTTAAAAYTGGSIFDEGGTSGPKRTARVSLLDDDDLFISSEATTDTNTQATGTGEFKTEDNSEILDVSESLDDVLQIVNKPKKGKSTAVKKVAPEKTGGGLFDVDDAADSKGIASMDTDDIMKYIQQNTADDDDLDLF